MADQIKQIKEFPQKTDFGDNDLLLIQGQGTTYSVKGASVKTYAEDAAKPQVALAAQQAQAAAEAANRAETAIQRPAIPDPETGNWMVWDQEQGGYVATNVRAEGQDFEIKGYYPTLAALEAAVPNPEKGYAYGVGTEAPYDIYVWDMVNQVWRSNGPMTASGDMLRSVYDPQNKHQDVFAYADAAHVGKSMAGKTVEPTQGTTVTAGEGAEIFNNYYSRTYGADAGSETVVPKSGNIASGKYSHAEGSLTTSSGAFSHSEGGTTMASGECAHAEGGRFTDDVGCTASGYGSHAEGVSTKASGSGAHAEGRGTKAEGDGAHSEGQSTTASKDRSHAEGYSTTAEGANAHAEGNTTQAAGQNSHAEGYSTTTSGYNAHAEGRETKAAGDNSHAEGYAGIAEGAASHVEGGQINNNVANKASGYAAHAEGASTMASGEAAHAEGRETVASGNWSHAEGCGTVASTYDAHAEGYCCQALGTNSHAGGQRTVAEYFAETAIGRYNVKENPSDYNLVGTFFVVGKGDSEEARANVFRVSYSGIYGAGAYNASGADYAELFEWADGNPDHVDRAGRFVTLDGAHIRLAGPEDDYILGVVSGAPSVVGDVYDDQWRGMYLTDVFGRPIMEDVEVPDLTETFPDPEDPENTITRVIIPAHTERRQKLNPAYDNTQPYVPRTERPEWAAVGLLGKLVAVDDGTCQANGWAKVGQGGAATGSVERTRYRVMERLDETHVRLMIL